MAQKRGLIARSRSFSNLNTSLEATAFFKPYVYKVKEKENGSGQIRWRSHSTGSVDFSRWSNKDFSGSMTEYMDEIREQSSAGIEEKLKNLDIIEGDSGEEIAVIHENDLETSQCLNSNERDFSEFNGIGSQEDHGPMGWGGMNAPGQPVTEDGGIVDVNPGRQTDHSPMGWGGMNAPDQSATRRLDTNERDPGKQTDHSPMGWGGMIAPDQSATRKRESSIVRGRGANQDILESPATAMVITTPKRKLSGDNDIGMPRRRRVSLNEYSTTASPSLRPDSKFKLLPPTGKQRTWSLGATPGRNKKTPRRRMNKMMNLVDQDQPLIRQMFSPREKSVTGKVEMVDGNDEK